MNFDETARPSGNGTAVALLRQHNLPGAGNVQYALTSIFGSIGSIGSEMPYFNHW
jgi:hypothetical protein